LVYEKKGLIHQIRIMQSGAKQELWCMKDEQMTNGVRVSCQTLYDVRVKKRVNEPLERSLWISSEEYQNLFGINRADMDRAQLIMFSHLMINMLFLNMPTIELSKGDFEDSDNEEEVLISWRKLDCVTHKRKIIEAEGFKVPFTIQLLGYNSQNYLGIKASCFNPVTLSETGVFFIVDQKRWELTDEEKAQVPKKRSTKQEVLFDYYHLPAVLQQVGFQRIFDECFLKSKEMAVTWQGPFGEMRVDTFDAYFDRF